MYKQKVIAFLVLFWTFYSFSAKSQIIITPSTGCAPLAVQFSGVPGASNEFWSLGSGMGTSLLSNPNALYTNGGTFNITYSAVVAGNPVTYTGQVYVKPLPSASFTYLIPPSHCAPMVVNFTAVGSSTNPVYTWAFGDLTGLATGATVTHTYTFGNSFIPVMTIFDAVTQCTALATTSSGGTIHVSNTPTINLTSSGGLASCIAPFITNLNASGSISGSPISGGGLTYNWNIAGGTPGSSSSSNPGPVTFGLGTHTISLQVTDNNQCSTSTTSLVNVNTPTLNAIVPPTVCINTPVPATIQTTQTFVSVYVTNSVSPFTTLTIPFGNTVIDTACIFILPGINIMTVNVPTAPGCPNLTTLIPVFVEEILPMFAPIPSAVTSCSNPSTITFTNLSTINNSSSMSYNWQSFEWETSAYNHGIPTSTTLLTPSPVTFTFWQGSLNPYTIYAAYIPVIKITVTSSPTGCSAGYLHQGYFTLLRPTAKFISSIKKGCAPMVITYTSTSFFNSSFPLASYTWCAGDSPPTFSSGLIPAPPAPGSNIIPPFTHTYTQPGTYYPYLMISTAAGCTDISYVDTITVVNPPSNLSASYPGTVCAGQPITINMNATGMSVNSSTGIDHWHVTTDNQFFSGCYTNSSPSFPFTHLGVHNVTVSASQAGCSSSLALVPTITVKGPLGKFMYETNCDVNRKMVKFHVNLQEAGSAVLNFGDGNQVTINGNLIGSTNTVLTHTYNITGDYSVSLVSTNGTNGCQTYTFSNTIKVRDAKARITYKGNPLPVYPAALTCIKSPIEFSAATSTDYSGCQGAFTWYFQSPPSINPAAPGITMTPLSSISPNYKTTYTVIPPPPVQYTIWSFVVPQLVDTFRTAGTYTIGLRVKDENSCIDIETKQFRVTNAEPDFTITPNPSCFSNGTVQLVNYTDANQVFGDVITKYTWIFGDGSPVGTSTTGLSTLTHSILFGISPTVAISASLIAENQVGCIDTAVVVWQVNRPFGNLSYATNSFVCIPKYGSGNLGFIANNGYPTYSISYGDTPGNPVWSTYTNTFTNVSHAYTVPGDYTTTLIVIDGAGCADTRTLSVQAIGQPTSSIYFVDGKSKFCIPGYPDINSSSSIFTSSITGYSWIYATPTNSIMSPPSGLSSFSTIINATGIFTISLQVEVDGYCPSVSSLTVGVYNPTATAMLTPTMFCLGKPIEAGINVIDQVYSWKWFFGDNVSQPLRIYSPSTPSLISYPYTIYPTTSTTGSTVVKLQYDSPDNGCSRVIEIPIQVIKIDADFKHQLEDYDHCLHESDLFINTTPNPLNLNLSYSWNFGDQTTASGANVTHLYTLPGTYSVSMLTKDSQFGCESTTIKSMTVFPLPSANIRIDKTLSCPNATFELQGSGVPGISGFVTATLSPVSGGSVMSLAPTNSFSTSTSASVNTIFTLTVSDENFCKSDPVFDTMFIQEPALHVVWDTAVIIGEITPLNAFLGNGFTYTWSPVITALNCDTCVIPNPVSNSMLNITYTVLVEDTLKCSIVKNTYRIKIIPKVSLDVPTAFTPNGDGVNDFIFPDGWGLKKLIYFKVFNRWGQLIFETNDINVGWDGNYEGVPQNMETYVYQVSAETLLETEPVLNKTGTFKLLR